MVAIITYPEHLLYALNYHEKKVPKGKAECLHAENFLLEAGELGFYDKLHRFQNQIELNKKIKTNLLHVSLNFEPSENLTKKELVELGTSYMERIGFGEQPYLVYQHSDAGHPHIHILTTTIKGDGSPIYLHNIGRNQSEKARTEIEQEYNLIQAKGRNSNEYHEIPLVDIQKIRYGEVETKRSITNVLDAVIKKYKYTSLPELNAILSLRNIYADRGKEGGRIHKNKGLVYRIIDDQGENIGKPVKASSIYSRPILAELEKKFSTNKLLRYSCREELKDEVTAILRTSENLLQFIGRLKENKIDTVIRRNDIGFIYGITFIDHKSKSVFNGSDLDKTLSAAKIQRNFSSKLDPVPKQPKEILIATKINTTKNEKPKSSPPQRAPNIHFEVVKERKHTSDELIKQFDLLKQLLQIENSFNPTPFGLTARKKKKKKKKRNQS